MARSVGGRPHGAPGSVRRPVLGPIHDIDHVRHDSGLLYAFEPDRHGSGVAGQWPRRRPGGRMVRVRAHGPRHRPRRPGQGAGDPRPYPARGSVGAVVGTGLAGGRRSPKWRLVFGPVRGCRARRRHRSRLGRPGRHSGGGGLPRGHLLGPIGGPHGLLLRPPSAMVVVWGGAAGAVAALGAVAAHLGGSWAVAEGPRRRQRGAVLYCLVDPRAGDFFDHQRQAVPLPAARTPGHRPGAGQAVV